MKYKNLLMICFAMLFVCCGVLAGCNSGKQKPVASIDIVGEFKTEYLIGEEFDNKNIKLKVVYDDETTDVISITNSMVLGFDSSDVAEQKTVTIVYHDKTLEKNYSVVGITLGIYSREEYDKNGNLQHNVPEYLNFGANGLILSVEPPYTALTETLWRYEDKKLKIYQVEEESYIYDIVDKKTLKLTNKDGSYELLCYKKSISL